MHRGRPQNSVHPRQRMLYRYSDDTDGLIKQVCSNICFRTGWFARLWEDNTAEQGVGSSPWYKTNGNTIFLLFWTRWSSLLDKWLIYILSRITKVWVDSIAVSLFVDLLSLSNTESEANPNNLMMRRAGFVTWTLPNLFPWHWCQTFDLILMQLLRDVLATKNGKMWEFFPSRDPPLPPVWEPHVCEKTN